MPTTISIQKRSIDSPDEVREFEKGRLDIVTLGDVVFARTVFQPGWRWSDHVRPIAGTESCEFPHRLYVASGSLHVRMDDGAELDCLPGDVVLVDSGHDAWVTSAEPCVMYDFGEEDRDYAKPRT